MYAKAAARLHIVAEPVTRSAKAPGRMSHLHAREPAQLLHDRPEGGRLVRRLRFDLRPQHLQQRAQRHGRAHPQAAVRDLDLQPATCTVVCGV